MYSIFTKMRVFTEKGLQKNTSVVIRDTKIHDIVEADATELLQKYKNAEFIKFPENFYLVPGFIDMHVHGANGSDVMDGTVDGLMNISQTLAKEGVTGFLATTMTAQSKDIKRALSAVSDFMKLPQDKIGAKILGVHLEGPFLQPKKVGAQRADQICAPKIEYIEEWQNISNNVIKLVTLAPELPGSLDFIKYLKQKNILAALGHTNATFAESLLAINSGCTHATHLFNAMRSLHQREPGVVLAALLSKKVYTEVIADGVHLHPAILSLILKLKGPEKILLVTDAMRAKCLKNGVYDLGGQSVTVTNEIAELADGTLAGSVLKMNSALANMLEFTGCNLEDALKMTAENPAKELGIFDVTGSIAVNKLADLVILDDKLNVKMTVSGGVKIFRD